MNKPRLSMLVKGVALLGVSILLLAGCLESTTPKDNQLTYYVKNSNAPSPTTEWYDEKSQYDFIHLTPGAWEVGRLMPSAGDSLRARNKDIDLGTYVSLFSVPLWMGQADTTRHPGRWFRDLSKFYAVTTEGDTASLWKKSHVFDVVNPKARAIAINEVNRYVREQRLGHVMLDWASIPMANLLQWQPQEWQDTVHGDLDFDRDGIGHWDDPDEQEMLRKVWYTYMEEMRAVLPTNCKIFINGSLAIKDPQFAKLVDGCYVEGFPNFFFGGVGKHYINALDPDYPSSLWNLANQKRWYGGEGYVLIEDLYNENVHAYLTQCFDNMPVLRRWVYDAVPDAPNPPDLDLGKPTGPATMEDGKIRRYFENGVIGVDVISDTQLITFIKRKGE